MTSAARNRYTALPMPERFWSKVDRSGGSDACWPWTAATQPEGYGHFARPGVRTSVMAHRMAYELTVGPIPTGLTIDHLCSTPACCNPAHMEPVTMRENVLRGDTNSGRNARKTHCVNGHPFDETVRLYITATKRERVCRQCQSAWTARRLAERQAARLRLLTDGAEPPTTEGETR